MARKKLYSNEIVYDVRNLVKHFPVNVGFIEALLSRKKLVVHAVEDVSFQVRKGEIFAVAGESGCGKTTTGRTIIRLEEPTAGEIFYRDVDIAKLKRSELREYRKKIQIIQQDQNTLHHTQFFQVIPFSYFELSFQFSLSYWDCLSGTLFLL